MKRFTLFILASLILFMTVPATAAMLSSKVYSTAYPEQLLGTVTFKDTPYGLLITPHLKGLSPGLHGFHIHQHADCSKQGKSAGGHFDPTHTGKHLGPYDANGHLGDLPVLFVTNNGLAKLSSLAPKLTVQDLHGHSLMIHKNADNYSDSPKLLGGGGPRTACGVID